MRKTNKPTSKKLNLDTQTVRELAHAELPDAAGAGVTGKVTCNSCTYCVRCWE